MDELHQDEQADRQLAERLLRGGVGLRHVRRALRELRDHRADLVSRAIDQGQDREGAIREARVELGDREDLARQMLARPELRSRARRFAWLWFLLGPVPMVFAAGLATMLAAIALYEVLGVSMNGRPPSAFELLLMQLALQWLAPGIVGLVLARIAVRRVVPAIYPLCAIALIALASSATHVSARLISIGWTPLYPARGLALFGLLVLAYWLLRSAQLHRGTRA